MHTTGKVCFAKGHVRLVGAQFAPWFQEPVSETFYSSMTFDRCGVNALLESQWSTWKMRRPVSRVFPFLSGRLRLNHRQGSNIDCCQSSVRVPVSVEYQLHGAGFRPYDGVRTSSRASSGTPFTGTPSFGNVAYNFAQFRGIAELCVHYRA